MPAVQNDRARLTAFMNERRIDLGLRWTDVGEAGGISAETLRAIRRDSAPLRELTKAGLEKGLRWKQGSVDSILAGGTPDPDDTPGLPDLSVLSPKEQRDLIGAAHVLADLIAKAERESGQRGA
jgi:hypothetical protein